MGENVPFFFCPDVGAVTAPWPHVVMCREREKSDLGFLLLIWGRGKEGCVWGGVLCVTFPKIPLEKKKKGGEYKGTAALVTSRPPLCGVIWGKKRFCSVRLWTSG